MRLFLPAIFLSLIASLACGAETSSSVTDPITGELLGEVTVDHLDFRGCSPLDEEEGRCDPADPVVCMTYGNGCYNPIICRLQVSARFAEPYTGFTKRVTDIRDEIVFYNSTHEVCFNFSKDVYHTWVLMSTSEPKIDCEPYVVGGSNDGQGQEE